MKNLLFGLIATVFITSNSFGQDDINMGELHNKVLTIYYQQNKDGKFKDLVQLNSDLFKINSELYPDLLKNISESDIEKFTFELYGTLDPAKFNYQDRVAYLLDQCVSKGSISKDLSSVYKKILISNPEKEEAFNLLDDFLKTKELKDSDKKSIDAFKSLYLASEILWSSLNENQNQTTARCNASAQISFADAFGGMIGGAIGSSVPGPGTWIGAFLGNQGMSALIRHLQANNGGSCI